MSLLPSTKTPYIPPKPVKAVAPPRGGAVAPPVTPKTSVTAPADPLYAAALAQAQATLAATQAPIIAQQQAAAAAAAARQRDAIGNAKALSEMLAGLAPGVSRPYEAATQNQGLLAGGYTDEMKAALTSNNDSLNAMLAGVNAPTTLDSHAGQAGDVTYALGGYIPGQTFAREGAAFGAAAAMLPQTALLRGADNAKSIAAQAMVADQGFSDKLAEMAGNLPGQVQDNYKALQQMALEDAKFRHQVDQDKLDAAFKRADQQLSRQKYATSVQEFNARQKLSAQKLNISVQEFNVRQNLSERKFAQQTINQNRAYAVSLAHLGIAQKRLQMAVVANAYKDAAGTLTPTQQRKIDTTLDSLQAQGVVHGGIVPDKPILDSKGKPTGKFAVQHTYGNFIRSALKAGVPIQQAIERANSIWPEDERNDLGELRNLPAMAAVAAAHSTLSSVGMGVGDSIMPQSATKANFVGPNGQFVTVDQLPKGTFKNVPPATQKKVTGIMELAKEYLGTPYAWGGESPTGFDCSGLAQYIYGKVGVSIPRTSQTQFQGGLNVPKSQLQAGDLVFFAGSDGTTSSPGHVGIYAGNGYMVVAPKTGDVVKVQKVNFSPGYYAGARRYVH